MREPMSRPPDCNAALVLEDGAVFWGRGLGAVGTATGEVCFNTAITGYQEILTDPSYAGQIITFTFPHIGNVGANREDVEASTPAVRGVVLRTRITGAANYRATQTLDLWLKSHGLTGISGIDTRQLTRRIRDLGAPNGVIAYDPDTRIDIRALHARARSWPGLEGMDLAKEVTCRQTYQWDEAIWNRERGYVRQLNPRYQVVAIDYGAKRNILRMLAACGCKVTVVPATASAEAVMHHRPDGIFLSNGPGDPAATAVYAVPVLRDLLDRGKPVFGICLGHQLLALALGGSTHKMARGHRGANHPVKDLATGKSKSPVRTTGLSSIPKACPRALSRRICRCSTAPMKGCRSPAGQFSRCSTTPRPAPARMTATTSSRDLSP
jgi:carbamoyl-phosphate synthase small subunit